MAQSSISFRDALSRDAGESLIFAADNLAQFTLAGPGTACKCDRALPGAAPGDIVVLREPPEAGYLAWLRSLELGPGCIVTYDRSDKSLSRLIAENPEPVLSRIRDAGRKPVYVPWYSGEAETAAAGSLGADLFGARPELTLKYNDKVVFKEICRRLNIPVVPDIQIRIQPESQANRLEFSKAVRHFLSGSGIALVRASMDNAGISLVFKTAEAEADAVYDRLVSLKVEQVLVEPFLEVKTSPNDQWVVTREKEIFHMGDREQICEYGTHHIATVKIPGRNTPEIEQVLAISRTLVQEMADAGYVGVAGIDYITTQQGEVFPVENNARFNGSSYVSLLLDALAARGAVLPCWKFIKVTTRPCTFEELARGLDGVLYDGTQKAAVFPYNCDTLPASGDFSVVLLGSDPDEITTVETRLGRAGIC